MEQYTTTRAMRFLPQMVVATVVVAVVPVVVAWWLRSAGVISSAWLCVAVALVLSLALSAAGSYWWTRRRKAADILFSELLVWGWLRRYRVERQLAGATALLGLLPGAEPGAGTTDVARRQQLLRQLGAALDAQDPYLDGHSRRVARYAATVARRMGLPDVQVKVIRAAAAVHDVGKLRVPPELLRKASPLTDAEFEAVMRHADEGAEMVSCLGDDELTEIVRHHHERFDGLGYPTRLRSVEIPLGARIVAVADTFDAITSARPYRPAARHKQAIDVLVANAGTQLDPDVVRAFLRYYAGRKASVMWVILAVSPQRAFAWMRHGGSGEPVPVIPVGELAASTVGRALVVAAAVGTSVVGVGVARYENHLPQNGTGLQMASAAPPALPLGAGPAGTGQASGSAAIGRHPSGGAADAAVHGARPSTDPLTKATRVLTSASRSTTATRSATVGGGTGSGPGGGGGGGSASATSTPAVRLGTGAPAAGGKPLVIQPPRVHSTPAAGGSHPSVPVHTTPPRTPGRTRPAAPAHPAPVSRPPSPPPPEPTDGGGDQGGGQGGGGDQGGGGPGGGDQGGPKQGGPGNAGGHPHGGPGNGGWGPPVNAPLASPSHQSAAGPAARAPLPIPPPPPPARPYIPPPAPPAPLHIPPPPPPHGGAGDVHHP